MKVNARVWTVVGLKDGRMDVWPCGDAETAVERQNVLYGEGYGYVRVTVCHLLLDAEPVDAPADIEFGPQEFVPKGDR